jgi:hypothetical protein
MKRRELFGRLASAAVAAQMGDAARTTLLALAEVVLPSELGARGRAAVVDGFVRWIRGYRAGAEMDHGYGFTRLRTTPASPAGGYPAHLNALDRAARAHGRAFASLPLDERRAIVERALIDAKIERLLPRPSGSHVAVDLMAFYFNSSDANDLCYRAAIGRDACRGLRGSEEPPEQLTGRKSRR